MVIRFLLDTFLKTLFAYIAFIVHSHMETRHGLLFDILLVYRYCLLN